MSDCRDCGRHIEFVRRDGKWVPMNPDATEHYLTCTSERARELRVRRGQEPGVFAVDPTRIRAYLDCPLYYKRRYVDRVPEYKGPPALLGIAVHQYAEARLRGEEPPAPMIPPEYARDWRIMRDTFESQLENGLWNLQDASIEDRLTWAWQDGATQVELQVVIDWWNYNNGYPVATDIKSGWGVDHDDAELFKISTEGELRKSVQGMANILVIGKHVDIEGGRFQEVHLRFGGEVVGADYELDDLDAFAEILKAQVARMIRDTEFVANPFCTVCPVGTHPMVRYPIAVGEGGDVVIEPPRTAEQARELAQFVHAARRIGVVGTEALNGWCKVNGPVGPFAHVEHATKRLTSWHHPPPDDDGALQPSTTGVEEAIRILHEQGWEDLLPELIVANGTKLRAVLGSKKKYVSLAAALAPLLVEEKETRFECSKNVEPEQPVLQLLQGGAMG